ncbi:MAG: PEGA domain-containing protein [Candidatus Diapherotrites archaeon]|nr:PEGA domain-containing protein [Candidatus Diapherotrites archaeon]
MSGYKDYESEYAADYFIPYNTSLLKAELQKSDANADSNTSDSNRSTAYECSESDGGQDYYAKGTTTTSKYDVNAGSDSNRALVDTTQVNDACVDAIIDGKFVEDALREYFCPSNTSFTSSVHYVCSSGCDDGACKKQEYGKIKVTSSPSKADVYVDERYAGMTPLTVKDQTTGTHKVLVKKKGYKDYSKSVVVKANRTTPMHAKLTKATTTKKTKGKSAKTTGAATVPTAFGKLQITSDPSGATVWLTNVGLNVTNSPGKTPLEMEVDVGTYKIAVELGGYISYIKTIKISANKTTKVHAKLKKETVTTGKLKITSTPSKADAYIRSSGIGEWESLGKTPVTIKSLATGSYEVSVKKKGYLEARQKVSVSANKTTSVKIKMLKVTEATCTDSDGGKDYYVQGVAKGIVNGLETFADDTCLDITKKDYLVDSCSGSNCYLNEGYCEDSTPVYESWVPCANGCNDGACLKEACTDTDGGIETTIKGTVTGTFDDGYRSQDDYCPDKSNVMEFYCTSEGKTGGDLVACAGSCEDGACVK